jgi:hypothetical protein
MKKFLLVVAGIFILAEANAQQKQDTVIVNLAKTSRIIFTVEDPEDLEILKHYDFQMLFEDILRKVNEKKQGVSSDADSVAVTKNEDEKISTEEETRTDQSEEDEEVVIQDDDDQQNDRPENENDNDDDDDGDDNNDENDSWRDHNHKGKWHRTWQAFNFDLGTNNYLSDKKFPSDNEAYAVRPWGSWYVAVASVQRSRITKKFFLEWGMGLSWYNFKFQHDNTVLTPEETGVSFTFDERDFDFRKSKLTATYVQASLIPVLDFGDHGRKARFWDGYDDNAFRIGFGPYLGYRISSHTKVVYEDDGRERDKDRDGFYLNNLRYGARLQLGYRSTDLFFNYDLNELFQDNKGPKLNAFSFGVIF